MKCRKCSFYRGNPPCYSHNIGKLLLTLCPNGDSHGGEADLAPQQKLLKPNVEEASSPIVDEVACWNTVVQSMHSRRAYRKLHPAIQAFNLRNIMPMEHIVSLQNIAVAVFPGFLVLDTLRYWDLDPFWPSTWFLGKGELGQPSFIRCKKDSGFACHKHQIH